MRERARLVGLLAAPVAFLAVFFAWPVANIVGEGLRGDHGWELHGVGDVLGDAALRRVAWFTLWQAAASTALTLVARAARRPRAGPLRVPRAAVRSRRS